MSGALADREWRLIPEEARPGPMQMALEEVAARTAVEALEDTLTDITDAQLDRWAN